MRNNDISRIFAGTLAATMVLNSVGGITQEVFADVINVTSIDDVIKQQISKSFKESLYLTEIDYIKELSKFNTSSVSKNTNADGTKLSLNIDGKAVDFKKGLAVGKTSEMVYDISEYSNKFDMLSTFVGVDSSEASDEKVRFLVYSSDDGEEWNPIHQSGFINKNDDAVLLTVNIEDVKYLKLITLCENEEAEVKGIYGDIRLLSTEELTVEEEKVKTKESESEDSNKSSVEESSIDNSFDLVEDEIFDTTDTEITDETDKINSSSEIENNDKNESTLLSDNENKIAVLATFSFDGPDAGKIMISSSLAEGAEVRYSLNKGAKWVNTTDHEIKLSDEEIKSITAANDIWVGLANSEDYTVIDILPGDAIDAKKLYKNDAENRFFGKTDYLQVSTDKGVTWKDYDSSMRFDGQIVVKVRYKAHGVYAMGAENQYTFSADTTSDSRKVVPVESIINHTACSQENATLSSSNMISGDGNTSWVSLAKSDDNDELFYTVEFDGVKYINEVEYLPYSMQKGRLKSGEIYASYDGQHWELIHQFSDLANNTNSKSIKFGTKVFTKYIKIVATETYPAGNNPNSENTYFSGNLFTFYEDSTVKYSDKPEIHYSTTDETNTAVTATLHLPDGFFTTERTHRFLTNDTYNFTYTDADDNEYTIEAEVNWIKLLSGDRGVYLSDMNYVPNLLDAWDGVKIDKNPASGDISLLVQGEKVGFSKGLGIHASSTIVYDVEAYAQEYTNLSLFMGVDASRNQNGSVKFTISGSNNGLDWEEIHTTPILRGYTDCEYINVDISNYSYIKLYADSTNDGAGSDHSVYADARLIRPDYDINTEKLTGILKVEEYDSLIKAQYTAGDEMSPEVKSLVMKRAFVDRYGYANIQQMGQTNTNYKEAIDYIFNNEEVISLFLEAGSLEYGTGLNGIRSWCRLYAAHKDDLSNEMHKKIMIATAVAMSRNIQSYMSSWGGGYRYADAVLRYNLMKKLYDEKRFLNYNQFNSLSMELIRSVVDARLGDDEILWIRNYTEHKQPTDIKKRLDPYTFISYIHPNYGGADLRDPNMFAHWDAKYLLSQNNVLDYGASNMPKIWMSVEKGGICWGISGFGSATNEVHGIPSINVYQPGHEAYITYSEDELGRGKWSIGNNITGWAKSYSKWAGFSSTFARMLLGWGNRSYSHDTKNNASYVLLAQGALNDYENYKKSMFYNFLAKSYEDDAESQIKIYNKALDIQGINLDSFEGLIKAYEKAGKSSSEWLALGKKIVKAYTYYPLPMVELLSMISSHVTTEIESAELDMVKTNALLKATNATTDVSLQADACKAVANSLLGTETTYLATFSFDGADAGKIVLNEKYRQYTVRVRYSIDGGVSYKQTNDQVIQLSDDEISQMDADKDLIVGLIGTEETYTIDIKKGSDIGTNTYVNDEENILIGGNLANLEYTFDGDNWEEYDGLGLKSKIRFEDEINPVVNVTFRYKAHGTYLAGNTKEFNFKFNPLETDDVRYLQLQHVSLHGFSTEQTNPNNKAQNILDGNPSTIWHTKWSYFDPDKYISVKFDKVRYISKITFTPSGANGRLKTGEIYTSLDGKEWTLVKTFTGFPNDDSLRVMDLGGSYEARYVKLVATSTYGQGNQGDHYLSGKLMSFYEDITKSYKANATINYSVTDPTSEPVTAYLELPEGCEAIGDTEHTFKKNGSFEFKFTDANGEEQSIFAEVSNIDESLPTMTYEFDKKTATNQNVILTVTGFSKKNVKIVDVKEASSSDVIVKTIADDFEFPDTYVFTKNKTLLFTLEDMSGNKNTIPVTVDWIDKVAPTAKVEYSTTSSTTKPVTVKLKDFSEDGVKVINNNGKTEYTFTKNGEFTFEIQDKAGNITKIPVKVSWIGSTANTIKLTYSTTALTNKNVTVKLEGLRTGDVIVNNQGKSSYVFKENGTFEFIIRDIYGNESKAIAMVDWIDKKAPTASIDYSTTDFTNDSVTVKLVDFSEDDVTITNNNGSNEYTFTENGVFRFELKDKAGNVSIIPVTVNWIVKDGPVVGVKFDKDTLTNQSVTATLTGLKDTDTVINNNNKDSYTFTKNGDFTFEVEDIAGNVTKVPVIVDWIDKVAPTATIEFSNDYWTSGNVVAKLVNVSEDITVTNTKNGVNTHTFTDNGEFEFKFVDMAGNEGSVKAVVNWIDKSKPVKEITFTETNETDSPVSVLLNVDLSKIEILNNGGSNKFTFSDNDTFTFKLRMKDTGYVFDYPVSVSWIVENTNSSKPNGGTNGNNGGSNNNNNSNSGNGNNSSNNNSNNGNASGNGTVNNNENTSNNVSEDNTDNITNEEINTELDNDENATDNSNSNVDYDVEKDNDSSNTDNNSNIEENKNSNKNTYSKLEAPNKESSKKSNWLIPVGTVSVSLVLVAAVASIKKTSIGAAVKKFISKKDDK